MGRWTKREKEGGERYNESSEKLRERKREQQKREKKRDG